MSTAKGIYNEQTYCQRLDEGLNALFISNIHIYALVLSKDTFDQILIELKLTEDDLRHLPSDIDRTIIPYNTRNKCILLFRQK